MENLSLISAYEETREFEENRKQLAIIFIEGKITEVSSNAQSVSMLLGLIKDLQSGNSKLTPEEARTKASEICNTTPIISNSQHSAI